MDAQVKTEKVEIPYRLQWGLNELYDLREHVGALRRIQTALGYSQFGSEEDIDRLRFITSQVALECIDRACRDTEKWVRERWTTKPSSVDVEF